jgi:predicted RNase H-like HicB family nuclease
MELAGKRLWRSGKLAAVVADTLDVMEIPAGRRMRTFSAVVENDPETGLFVGYVPGFPGAHELGKHLEEVIAMLLEDGEPQLEREFVGVHTIMVT